MLEAGYIYIFFDQSNNGIMCSYENDWIHRVLLGDDTEEQHSVSVLPSRLHEK